MALHQDHDPARAGCARGPLNDSGAALVCPQYLRQLGDVCPNRPRRFTAGAFGFLILIQC